MDGTHLAAHVNNQDPLPGGFQQASGCAALMAIWNHFIANKLFSMAYNTVTMPITVTVNFINSYTDLFTPSWASAVTPSLDPAPAAVTRPFLSGYNLPSGELYRLAMVHSGPTSLFWQTSVEHVESMLWQDLIDEELATLQAWIDELKMMAEQGIGYPDFDAEARELPESSLVDRFREEVGSALDIVTACGTLLRRHFGKILVVAFSPFATYRMLESISWTFGNVWPNDVCLWSELGGIAFTSVGVLAAIGILHEICDSLIFARYGVAALRLATATLAWVSSAVYTTVSTVLICAVAFTLIVLAVVTLLSCASRIQWYDPHWSSPVPVPVAVAPSPTSSNPSTTTKTPSTDGISLPRDTSASASHVFTGSSHETTDGSASAARPSSRKASGLPRKTNTYRAPSMESDSEDDEISSVSTRTSEAEGSGSGARNNARPIMVDRQTSPPPASRVNPENDLKKRKAVLPAVAAGSLDDDDDDTPLPVSFPVSSDETKDAQKPAPFAQDPAPLPHIGENVEEPLQENAPSQDPPASPSTSSASSSTTSSDSEMPAPTTPEASHAPLAEEESRMVVDGQGEMSGYLDVAICPDKVRRAIHKFRHEGGEDAAVPDILLGALKRLDPTKQIETIPPSATMEEIVEEVIEKEEAEEEEVDDEEAQAPAPFEYPREVTAVKPFLLILPAPAGPTLEVIVWQPIVEGKEEEVVVQVPPAETPDQTPADSVKDVALPVVTPLDDVAETLALNEDLARACSFQPYISITSQKTLTLRLQPLEEQPFDEPDLAAPPAIVAVAPEAVPLPDSPVQEPVERADEAEPIAAVEAAARAAEVRPGDIPVKENDFDVAAEVEEDYVMVPNVADILADMGPEDNGEAIDDEEAEAAEVLPTHIPVKENVSDVAQEIEEDYVMVPNVADMMADMGPEDNGEAIDDEEVETTQTSAAAATPTSAPSPASAPGPRPMGRPNTWEEIVREFPNVPRKFEGINLTTRYTTTKEKAYRDSLRRWVHNAMKRRKKQAGSALSTLASVPTPVLASVSTSVPASTPTSDSTPSSTPAASTSKSITTAPETETDSATFAGQELLPPLPLLTASPTSPISTPTRVRSPIISSRMAADQLFSDSDDGGWETVVAGKRCVRVSSAAGAGKSTGEFGSKSFFAALEESSIASEASDEERSQAGAAEADFEVVQAKVEVEAAKPDVEVDAERGAEIEADANSEAEVDATTELKTAGEDDVRPTSADVSTPKKQRPEEVEEGWDIVDRKKGKNPKPTYTASATPATEAPAPIPIPASSSSPFIINFNYRTKPNPPPEVSSGSKKYKKRKPIPRSR